ncbi:MAG: hypothetical protein AB7N76_28415 [Planctomycetota bacterium]
MSQPPPPEPPPPEDAPLSSTATPPHSPGSSAPRPLLLQLALIDGGALLIEVGLIELLLRVESRGASVGVFMLTQALLLVSLVQLRRLGAASIESRGEWLRYVRLVLGIWALLLPCFDLAVFHWVRPDGPKRLWEDPLMMLAVLLVLANAALLVSHVVLPERGRWQRPDAADEVARATWLNAIAVDLHLGVATWLLLTTRQDPVQAVLLASVFLIPRLLVAQSRGEPRELGLALLSGAAQLGVAFLWT